jgi:hypothetical protein
MLCSPSWLCSWSRASSKHRHHYRRCTISTPIKQHDAGLTGSQRLRQPWLFVTARLNLLKHTGRVLNFQWVRSSNSLLGRSVLLLTAYKAPQLHELQQQQMMSCRLIKFLCHKGPRPARPEQAMSRQGDIGMQAGTIYLMFSKKV